MSNQKCLLPDDDLEAVLRPPPITDQPSAWYGHIPFANWIVAKARPKLLVELGAHAGISYSAFCNAVLQSKLSTRCFAVDTWQGDRMAGYYGEDVYERFSRFHEARFGAFSTLIRSTFDTALPHFSDGSIDLLHLDGLHTYDAVRHDFETWQPKLSDRAIVLFHDTNERAADFGVWRYWNELAEKHPSFNFPHCHGLGVLCYGKNAPSAATELARLDESDAERFRFRFQAIGERWIAEYLRTVKIQEVEEARGRLQALQSESNSIRIELTTAKAQIANLQSDVCARDTMIQAIHDSTSWRITGPMRTVAGALRRSRRPHSI